MNTKTYLNILKESINPELAEQFDKAAPQAEKVASKEVQKIAPAAEKVVSKFGTKGKLAAGAVVAGVTTLALIKRRKARKAAQAKLAAQKAKK